MTKSRMHELVLLSLGEDAANLYGGKGIDDGLVNDVLVSSRRILSMFPYHPLICMFVNACWAVDVMARTGMPVAVVAGGLGVGPFNLFDAADEIPISELIAHMDEEGKVGGRGWNGHIWCDFDGLIGDASIFRTGQINPKSMLFRVTSQNLYAGEQVVLKFPDEFTEMEYRPHYVLNEAEVTGLVRGAATHLQREFS